MLDLPKRKNIRLKDFDYSQNGAYFITICTKTQIFWNVGAIINRPQDSTSRTNLHRPALSKYGMITESAINEISNHYSGAVVDKYVVMPNHIHMIIFLNNDYKTEKVRTNGRLIIAPTATPTISTIIQQMKRYVTKQIGHSIWQKSFYDHIIRDEKDYQKIWQYIDENTITSLLK